MKLATLALLSALSGTIPLTVTAQQVAPYDDVTYCKTLAQTWQRWRPGRWPPTVGEDVAATGCARDTQDSIEALENLLSRNKFDLPPRPAVARTPEGTTNTLH
jgi:hypothetical protein